MKKKIVDSHCHLNLLGSKELIGIKEEDLLNTKKKIITSRLIESIKNHVEIIQNIFVTLEEFEKFYRVARNFGTRSLNIDNNSVFFFGLLKKIE